MIDRATISPEYADFLDAHRIKSKHRRDMLRARRLCINGAHHGPATCGVLCPMCREVHRRSR